MFDFSSLLAPSYSSASLQTPALSGSKAGYDPYDIQPPNGYQDNAYTFSGLRNGGDIFGGVTTPFSPQTSSLDMTGLGKLTGTNSFSMPSNFTSLFGGIFASEMVRLNGIFSGLLDSIKKFIPPNTSGGGTGYDFTGGTGVGSGSPGTNTDSHVHGHGHDNGNPNNTQDTSATSGSPDMTSTTHAAAGLPAYSGEPIVVNKTIVVKAGQTFDGGNRYYKAGPALGDGGQSESQKPVFILEKGATLKNVQLSGADGIHVYGDGNLINVWNRDVGEDAVTLKSDGNLRVIGGGAFNATDKIFQLNANGSLHIEGFLANTYGKAVRTNGGHNLKVDISIINSTFLNGDEAVVRTDSSPNTRIFLQGVKYTGAKWEVLAPQYTLVKGATSQGYKPYSG